MQPEEEEKKQLNTSICVKKTQDIAGHCIIKPTCSFLFCISVTFLCLLVANVFSNGYFVEMWHFNGSHFGLFQEASKVFSMILPLSVKVLQLFY